MIADLRGRFEVGRLNPIHRSLGRSRPSVFLTDSGEMPTREMCEMAFYSSIPPFEVIYMFFNELVSRLGLDPVFSLSICGRS